MKTKIIFTALSAIMVLGIFSFINSPGDDDASVVLISELFSGDSEGFIITYDGVRKELRPFNPKLKQTGSEGYINVQLQSNQILTEFKKKGYRIVGSHPFRQQTLILEKN